MSERLMNTVERLPVNIVEGYGPYLVDDRGKRYIDLWGDEGVASLGYGRSSGLHGIVARAIDGDLPQRLPDVYPNPIRSQAADLLCAEAGMDRVFFTNSGAESVEAAIKLARRFMNGARAGTDCDWILTVEGNFHGRSGFALAASDSKDSPYHKVGYGPIPSAFGVLCEEDIVHGPAGGTVWCRTWANGMPSGPGYMNVSLGWRHVAAVIMAPILGNNTLKSYPEAFWKGLAKLREEHGFLLIFDEIQIGSGRSGYFCGYQHPQLTYGVKPDIMTLAKGLALGLPAGACLAREPIGSAFTPGAHFNTFGGGILVCSAITELIRWLQNGGYQHVRSIGNMITDWFDTQEWIADYDGVGVHWAFTPKWEPNEQRGFNGFDFCNMARDHGLLMVTHRPFGPIRFTPPLNVTEETIEAALTNLALTYKSLTE